MAQHAKPGSTPDDAWLPPAPDVSHLITEDGKPVDSFLSEKQMRLLTATLYESWTPPEGRRFLAAMNVGVFAVARNPAIVPDVFLSLDVDPPALTGPDRLRSYFIWEFGKPPDIAIEIVSDTEGDELSAKLRDYERMRVAHYVVFDPLKKLSKQELSAFALDGVTYVMHPAARFEKIGLGLVVWEGELEGIRERWLRWTDLEGNLIPTGAERAETEKQRAETEKQRAETEKQRADQLAAKLRALGVDPDA
ncbi:MAG: Uma2 family endonuclease [Labilithrix sp.]|nr:Uma2 family endonuclease [Labilithrix sp.]MCW5812426.1 Uma2 family endonuclease [Labilithrix sp.]